MAVAVVVPNLVPDSKKVRIKSPVDPEDIIAMVASYQDKIADIAPEIKQLPHYHQIEMDEEHLVLVLKRESVELILEQEGCKDLVAVFAMEKGENRNTVILMGLDIHGELLSDESGEFGNAEETWPVRVKASSEREFKEFFKKLYPPAK